MQETVGNPPPLIDEALRRKAAAIAIFMGGDYGMTADVGPWGSGWFWDFGRNHVNMDAKDLATESEDVVKGIASHEGNHRLASRPEHVQDLWREPGFAFGFNAVEDPRVNESGMHHRPGSRDWINAYIERDLDEGGGLNYQNMTEQTRQKIGYVPKHMQWGAEMIRYWYENEFGDQPLNDDQKQQFLDEIPEETVRNTVESSLDDFEDFYHAIPETKDEVEVQRKARISADIFKDRMWPKYKELVEQAYDEQALIEMIKDMLQNDQQIQQGQGGDGQSIEIPLSSLPQDIQDEIRKKIQEQQQAKSDQQNKADGEQAGEQDDKQQSGQAGDSGQGKAGTPIPWDELSDDAKQAAQEAFDDLSDNAKQGYNDKAKEELEAAEDDANEQLRGKMNDPRHTETHEEANQREAKEAAEEQQKQAVERARQELESRHQEALAAIPRNSYHEFLRMPDVASAIRTLDREFRKIFTPDEIPDTRYSYSGLRPTMRKAMGYAADRRKSNIFEAKGRPTERSHRFMWQVDCSGSMSDKIEETFKIIVTNTELAAKYDLETAVVGFTDRFDDNTKVYKEFEVKRLNNDVRDKLGEMIMDAASGGLTPLLSSTKRCFKMLKDRMTRLPMEHNYFITLTDGGASDCLPEELAEQVKNIRKDRSVVTSGFGIGPGTEYVNEIFPQLHPRIKQDIAQALHKPLSEISNSFESASDFAVASVIIMRYMVEKPNLFYG